MSDCAEPNAEYLENVTRNAAIELASGKSWQEVAMSMADAVAIQVGIAAAAKIAGAVHSSCNKRRTTDDTSEQNTHTKYSWMQCKSKIRKWWYRQQTEFLKSGSMYHQDVSPSGSMPCRWMRLGV